MCVRCILCVRVLTDREKQEAVGTTCRGGSESRQTKDFRVKQESLDGLTL